MQAAVVTSGFSSNRLEKTYRPLVSLVIPAYNEVAILEKNLHGLCSYLDSLENEYRWELIIINDGSSDGTGKRAEAFARTRKNIFVLHHPVNCGIGRAFKTAFNLCHGDYVVTLDLDLSYSPEHIRALLAKISDTGAEVVVASPYQKGGRISNVPWLRRTLSIWANRFLSFAAGGRLSTLTGMVRAYDGRFIRTLNLKSQGMEVNPEIIHKAMLLGARVEESPAHLNWEFDKTQRIKRRPTMRLLRSIMSVLLSGFLFRPVVFFVFPGSLLLAFAIYVNGWVFAHFLREYERLDEYAWVFDRASAAVAAAYQQFPHTFLVGGLSLMFSLQLISLGILSLQSKSYFEEIFHLGSAVHKRLIEDGFKDKKMGDTR